jgi:hypothetical protein
VRDDGIVRDPRYHGVLESDIAGDNQHKMMAMWLPMVAVCVWSFGIHVTPIDCSHFMGGMIYWKPMNPAAFDGRVRI